jgi:tetratricopeptide (TPR) repeat protein
MKPTFLLIKLIFIFCLGLSFTIQAQLNRDSLLHVIKVAPDTEKVKTFLKFSSYYRNEAMNLNASRKIAGIAYRYAGQCNWPKGRIQSLLYIGLAWHIEYNEDSAMVYFRKALDIASRYNNLEKIAVCYGSMGLSMQTISEYKKAAHYFDKAYEVFALLKDSTGMAKCLLNAGINHDNRGDIKTAIHNYEEVYRIGTNMKDESLTISALNNLAVIFLHNNDDSLAIKYSDRVLQTAIKIGDRKSESNALNNLGNSYQNLGDTVKALEKYKAYLVLVRSTGNREGEAIALNNIGSLIFAQGKYLEALDYFNSAMQIGKEIGNEIATALYTRNVSDVYLMTGDYKKAAQLAEESFLLAKSVDALKEETSALKNMSEAYTNLGLDKKANENLRLYQVLNDSLQRRENRETLQEMRVRYETDQQNQRINNLMQQQEIDRYRMIVLGFIALIISLILILYFRIRAVRSNTKRELAEVRLQNAQLEGNSLKSELEFKKRDVANAALHLVRQYDFLESLKEQINEMSRTTPGNEGSKYLSLLSKKITQAQSFEKERKEFQQHIEIANDAFFRKLNERYPNLTENEKRLCGFLRLDLSSKEVAVLMNISPSSVDMNRHRLRKKIGLEKGNSLIDMIKSL